MVGITWYYLGTEVALGELVLWLALPGDRSCSRRTGPLACITWGQKLHWENWSSGLDSEEQDWMNFKASRLVGETGRGPSLTLQLYKYISNQYKFFPTIGHYVYYNIIQYMYDFSY